MTTKSVRNLKIGDTFVMNDGRVMVITYIRKSRRYQGFHQIQGRIDGAEQISEVNYSSLFGVEVSNG